MKRNEKGHLPMNTNMKQAMRELTLEEIESVSGGKYASDPVGMLRMQEQQAANSTLGNASSAPDLIMDVGRAAVLFAIITP
jgi:hypothetical protein